MEWGGWLGPREINEVIACYLSECVDLLDHNRCCYSCDRKLCSERRLGVVTVRACRGENLRFGI